MHKILVFGEVHPNGNVTNVLNNIISRLKFETEGYIFLVMEHFNFEMQYLIDDYVDKKIGFKKLLEEC
jgi:uncharacterized iron-regulated protein